MQTPSVSAGSWDEQKLDNARVLENAIVALENSHQMGFIAEVDLGAAEIEGNDLPSSCDHQDLDFGRLWNDVRVVRDVFKETRPVDPELRQALWERLGRFCEAAKEIQTRQRDRRSEQEDVNRDRIAAAIKTLDCSHELKWAEDLTALKADLKIFWDDAREVSRLFKDCKPLRREDREQLWITFQQLCEKAHYYQNEAIEEGQRRYQEWRARASEKLDSIQKLLEKNLDVIARLQEQIGKCEEMRDTARSPEFALEVQGWIDDKSTKIAAIQETNVTLTDKATDLERRLQGEIK